LSKIRVLLSDRQPITRYGVRALLEQRDELEVAEVEGCHLLPAIERVRPGVVVMDVDMPVSAGLSALREIARRPRPVRPAVLVLTSMERDDVVFAALRAGARGFLLKGCPREDVLRGVLDVAAGQAAIAPAVAGLLLSRIAPSLPVSLEHRGPLEQKLTVRERQVLQMVALGRSNSSIARTLNITDATVRSHVHHLLVKLDLTDRTQAVSYAYRSGFASPFD
jgi:DNA-binding NarL/FixJ family response regulator